MSAAIEQAARTPQPPAARLEADPAEIRRAIDLLCDPAGVYELRALNTLRGTISGYFDDAAKLVGAAASITAPGVYLTINPCRAELLSRARNRLVPYCRHTTADSDIVARRWLPLDFDAVRPAGISSTEEERNAALAKAREVRGFLSARGWPAPIFADSGNGAHLVYKIDLPNDNAAAALIKRVLAALDSIFSDDRVAVDLTTFNAGRIWKCYGTVARKGDSTPERPHRSARIIEAPDRREAVAREQLEAIAALLPEPERRHTEQSRGGFDLDQFIAARGIAIKRRQAWSGGERLILEHCVFDANHGGSSAAILQFSSGAIVYRCLHNGCQGRTWEDVRELLEPRQSNRPAAPALPELEGIPQPVWPTLDPAALYGLAGEFVNFVGPETEADPAALLVQFLAAFGSAGGKTPCIAPDGTTHYTNLFTLLCGSSSKARKGSSWTFVRRLFELAEPEWARERIQSGLSSGEGLIWAVRDPILKREVAREKGRPTGEYIEVEADAGVADKRLLMLETEFASVLKMLSREGNNLSAVIRQAWDTGTIRTLTKNSPAVSTGAHVTIIGHVTIDELLRHFDSTEAASGFGNRFLWVCVRRSKYLPRGGRLDGVLLAELADRLKRALDFTRRIPRLEFGEDAFTLWDRIYPALSADRPGLLGAMVARGEAQVARLAFVFAALDRSPVVLPEHLKAALAVWEFCEASAEFVFGGRLGDPIADAILERLRGSPDGLSRTAISGIFARNIPAEKIERALALLQRSGLAERKPKSSHGPELWRIAATKTTKTTKTTPVDSQSISSNSSFSLGE